MAPFQLIFFFGRGRGEYFCGRMPRLRIIFLEKLFRVYQHHISDYFSDVLVPPADCRPGQLPGWHSPWTGPAYSVACYVSVYRSIMHTRTKHHCLDHKNSTSITQFSLQHCAKYTAYENVSNHGGSAEATRGCGTALHVFSGLISML